MLADAWHQTFTWNLGFPVTNEFKSSFYIFSWMRRWLLLTWTISTSSSPSCQQTKPAISAYPQRGPTSLSITATKHQRSHYGNQNKIYLFLFVKCWWLHAIVVYLPWQSFYSGHFSSTFMMSRRKNDVCDASFTLKSLYDREWTVYVIVYLFSYLFIFEELVNQGSNVLKKTPVSAGVLRLWQWF